jgi:hypothetical protein
MGRGAITAADPPNIKWAKIETIREVVLRSPSAGREIVYGLTDAGVLYVTDWTDPDAPFVVGQYADPLWQPVFVAASDRAIFVGDASQGGRVVVLPGQALGGTVTAAPPPAVAPGLSLSGAPNPFAGSTSIRFTLGKAGPVELAVYDVAGRLVSRLGRGRVGAGAHDVTWDGRDESGRAAAAGVYFVRLSADGGTATRRLVRVR